MLIIDLAVAILWLGLSIYLAVMIAIGLVFQMVSEIIKTIRWRSLISRFLVVKWISLHADNELKKFLVVKLRKLIS